MSAKLVEPTVPFERFRKEDMDQSIPARFEQMVEQYPDRLAVKSKHHALTYRELNRAANQIAYSILKKCGEGNELVALLLEQGAPLITAILGTLKAGKIHVPVDPSYPQSYCAAMMESAGAKLIVSDNENLSLVEEYTQGSAELLNLDTLDADLPAENVGLVLAPDELAIILYTSGSTGQPKGVVHSHRNILCEAHNYTNWLHIHPEDRLILCHSCSFANSVRTVYGGLMNGASIFPYSIREDGLTEMARWMIQERITVFRSIPTTFRHFINALPPHAEFPDIRILHVGGEPLTKNDFELYKKHFSPLCLLCHALGPTESFTIRRNTLSQDSEMTESAVPAGYPTPFKETLLVDDAGIEVKAGEVGEIAVRSRYMTSGYWKQPELTESTFTSDPNLEGEKLYRTGDLGQLRPDGCLIHMGRKDFQVKIRGFRIELPQIEIALGKYDAIREVVVHPQKSESGEHRLVAYIVPQHEDPSLVGDLRKWLKGKIPEYMMPSAFVLMEELPLTTTGKVDRPALPDPGSDRPTLDCPFVAPRTLIEEEISRIWEEALGISKIGVKDTFVELGGDSLRASQVTTRVVEKYNVNISPAVLLQTSTVEDMASAVVNTRASQIDSEEMGRLLDELEGSSG